MALPPTTASASSTLRERVEGLAARRILRLPPAWLSALIGARRRLYDGTPMDPPVQLAMELHALLKRPSLDRLSVAQARAEFCKLVRVSDLQPRPLKSVVDRAIPGPDGPLGLRIYRDLPGVRPALVYLHGGGYVLGSLESHDPPLRELAHQSGCVIIAVDYRLAPEHPFPAAPDDARCAFEWVLAHAAELEIDPARVAMGGDSAGGNLTAVVCQRLVAEGRTAPTAQLLIYPAMEMETLAPSRLALTNGIFLEPALIAWFMENYLQGRVPRDDVRVSPLRANDLSGQPPALVLTCGFDPLQDEGVAYGKKLQTAGVGVEFLHYPAQIHGLLGMAGVVADGRAAIAALAGYLREQTARGD